jgi:hypothetical protein
MSLSLTGITLAKWFDLLANDWNRCTLHFRIFRILRAFLLFLRGGFRQPQPGKHALHFPSSCDALSSYDSDSEEFLSIETCRQT